MDLFSGTQYKHDSENKTILLDISGNDLLTKTDFLETLENKLILDEEYEVYFESITTFKTKKNTGTNDICFLLKFHDFNIQNGFNYKNNANTLTKLEQKNILIPNSCITDDATAVSKGKKLNFICSLLPIKISEIHLSLTNLDNATIFTANDGRAIIELLCIPKNKKLSEKEKLDLALYEHTNYFDDRNKHLIIDLESTTGDPKAPHLKDFSVDLVEPLIIDRQSDIYLDSTIANKVNDKNDINTNNMGLLLSIDEFDIDNGYNLSTNNKLESHKMLIPNENFSVLGLSPITITEDFSDASEAGGGTGFSGQWRNGEPAEQINLDFKGLNENIFETGTWNANQSNNGGDTSTTMGPGSGIRPSGVGFPEQYGETTISSQSKRHSVFTSNTDENGTNASTHYFGLNGNLTNNEARYIRTKNINSILINATKITIDYIIGSDYNGGNKPENQSPYDQFGINILTSIIGVYGTQTINTHYMRDDNYMTTTDRDRHNYNFLIEKEYPSEANSYAPNGNRDEWKRISFCPEGSSIAQQDTYPHIYELPGLGISNANYLEFISFGTGGGSFDSYGIKYISIEYNTTSTTKITKSNKSTKYNYISTVNPKIISKINGSISNLNNASIVDPNEPDCRVVMDFLIKPCL